MSIWESVSEVWARGAVVAPGGRLGAEGKLTEGIALRTSEGSRGLLAPASDLTPPSKKFKSKSQKSSLVRGLMHKFQSLLSKFSWSSNNHPNSWRSSHQVY